MLSPEGTSSLITGIKCINKHIISHSREIRAKWHEGLREERRGKVLRRRCHLSSTLKLGLSVNWEDGTWWAG